MNRFLDGLDDDESEKVDVNNRVGAKEMKPKVYNPANNINNNGTSAVRDDYQENNRRKR